LAIAVSTSCTYAWSATTASPIGMARTWSVRWMYRRRARPLNVKSGDDVLAP